jgi:Activator of Hsp90 ATPase homolog 1-like protein
MQTQNYVASITVNATPKKVFETINNVTAWWTENLLGSCQQVGDEFTVRFDDIHTSTQKLIEVVPDAKVVWLVTDSTLNFVAQKHEWTGTTVSFNIVGQGSQTEINFTHVGLVPSLQCYSGCTKGWDYYIKGSLYKLLTDGQATPGKK